MTFFVQLHELNQEMRSQEIISHELEASTIMFKKSYIDLCVTFYKKMWNVNKSSKDSKS